jgi:hypothetical protein
MIIYSWFLYLFLDDEESYSLQPHLHATALEPRAHEVSQ